MKNFLFAALSTISLSLYFLTPAFAFNPANIPAVSTIAAMEALGTASEQYPTLQVLGYNTISDGGGGLFTYTASTITPDQCVNFAPSAGGGTWVRQLNGQDLTSLDCGAYNNNTNATATQTALQAGVSYLQSTQQPQAGFHIVGGTYACGSGSSCVQTNASQWCPRIYGDGPGSTDVQYTPSSEEAAFNFNSGSGDCNGGGVENLRVTGNSYTNACEFLSTNNAHCSVQANGDALVALYCSCTSGGFSENDSTTILTGSTVANRFVEWRSNNSGTGSFRNTIVNGIIALPLSGVSEVFLIDSGSQLYSAAFNLSVNFQPGTTGVTNYLFDDASSNTISASGTFRIENDAATNPSIFQLVKDGSVLCACTMQEQITGTAQLVYGAIVWPVNLGSVGGSLSFKAEKIFGENAASAVQYLTAGTGASTTLTGVTDAGSTNLFDIQIYNGTTLNWAGQVLTTSSTIGAGSAVILGGHAFYGTAPTFTATTAGIPIITEPDAVTSNSTRVFWVDTVEGQSN